MRRLTIVLLTVLVLVVLAAQAASAGPLDPLVEKLFGCQGVLPISCPGPLPW